MGDTGTYQWQIQGGSRRLGLAVVFSMLRLEFTWAVQQQTQSSDPMEEFLSGGCGVPGLLVGSLHGPSCNPQPNIEAHEILWQYPFCRAKP